MKNRLFIVAMLMICFAQFGKAQDVINYQNGEQVQAKILEISGTKIKFKKFNNPDGPTYTIDRNAVASISYENGETVIITSDDSVTDNSIITYHEKKFYINEARHNKEELLDFVKNNNETAYLKFDEGFQKKARGNGQLATSVTLYVLSIPFFLSHDYVLSEYFVPILDIAATTLLVFGFVNKSIGEHWLQDGCDIYNSHHKSVAKLDFGFTGNGIGMTLSF